MLSRVTRIPRLVTEFNLSSQLVALSAFMVKNIPYHFELASFNYITKSQIYIDGLLIKVR